MATATNDADELRRQMALIRRDLHEDVRGVVASAEAVTDWQRYIRSYPWVALGGAAAVGYLIVPRRHKAVATKEDVAKVRAVVEQAKDTAEKAPRKGLLAAGFAMLAPVAVRAAQGYAVRYLENWITQLQNEQMMSAGGAHRGPSSSPAGTGPKAGI